MKCNNCNGTGYYGYDPCDHCGGFGVLICENCGQKLKLIDDEIRCTCFMSYCNRKQGL